MAFMNEMLDFLTRHGPVVLFVAVFIEQIGVPVPAAPWILAAGALAGAGKLNGAAALAAGVLGSLVADLIWFRLGRHYGTRVLKLICRLSLEQNSCVRRTQDAFARYGMRAVIAAKFIPGLSTLAPPMAGSSGVRALRFFWFDAVASLLYVGGFIYLGVLFSKQLGRLLDTLASLGNGALVLIIALIALYITYKYFQRHRILAEVRTGRMTVDELHQKIQDGESIMILDLRPNSELETEPLLIPGALRMTLDELQSRNEEFPRDHDIVLYCSCPDEETSARAALLLRRNGVVRVHPLLGGFDAWRARNYPTQTSGAQASVLLTASVVNK
jgi:membrane protein DedA with SNARE-associated domain/rhodanese-related sulfurtransferase